MRVFDSIFKRSPGFGRTGVHPDGRKNLSKDKRIEALPAPAVLHVPLSQHIGKPARAVVAAGVSVVAQGDTVKKGQLIAAADGLISAAIFSPVSGTVKEIKNEPGVNGLPTAHVLIENDFKEEAEYFPPLENPSPEEIRERIREAGIVGMGGAGFPTAVKLTPAKAVDTIIINAAECEPYITCDHRLMLEYPEKVMAGAALIAECVGAESVVIAIEDNKPDAIAAMSAAAEKFPVGRFCIAVVPLKTRYPQGAEKQLIFAALRRKVPTGGLPMDVGVIVNNTHTALAVCEAVNEGKPLFERVMTVSGKGIGKPGNYLVRIGTRYSDIIEALGENEGVGKIINGGPMMGFAQYSRDVSVTKTTSSLLLLLPEEYDASKASACINCGRCGRACPMHLMPMYIDAYTIAGDFSGAKKYGCNDCIECGCCTYVCPAKRPLIQTIKLAKKIVKERNI